MSWSRRAFLGATAAIVAAPATIGQARPRVVVIGGGAGGATAARYLARDGKGALDVTLVEPNATYHTCFFSNLYVGGFRDYDSLGHGYERLVSAHGVRLVADRAAGVDRDARVVATAGGEKLPYDHLVVSPGIDFVEGSVPGWSLADAEAMPHAYKGGEQVRLLRAKVEALPEGGVFAMVAPPNPYRCPPGPYERISMIAHLLKQRNPTAKILLIDPKDKYSKQALFEEGWQKHYPGMITRIGPDFGGANVEVRPAAMEVVVDGQVEKVDAATIIPAQRAGDIAAMAGLTNDAGWAPIDPGNMRSRMDPAITVLGDAAQQGDMPKSAFAANSQAKVAANAIRGELTGSRVFPAKYSNTCWSLIATEDGVKVGAAYEPTPEKIASVDSFISQTGEDARLRKATFEESLGWYAGITADMFG
ncbi:NAD(P)/FAD-dependent oxidoreductase [Limibaculum sp. FT325]|uniref:NAD(P)/FAD-dependent oxidoreductase n=1 Tax=Thermohalobaculum sediminis TaxID=2939436 RepID=UPI0020BDDD21|nr:NAD(P)/FAD-dependent oxidoreductase [Limibaculum sediminis]MCL5778666.1 NAD(P)/FAD-dependent oxidoreductase [Limibaculum sediminis]